MGRLEDKCKYGKEIECIPFPDDVPLAFQNTEVELTQNGHDYWEWHLEGDNHGSTSKIMEHWYFFKASF